MTNTKQYYLEQLEKLRVEYMKAKTPLDRQIIELKARPFKTGLNLLQQKSTTAK